MSDYARLRISGRQKTLLQVMLSQAHALQEGNPLPTRSPAKRSGEKSPLFCGRRNGVPTVLG